MSQYVGQRFNDYKLIEYLGGGGFADSGHTYPPSCLAWSPDGARVASLGSDPRSAVHVWDAETGATIRMHHDFADEVDHIVWSPDGTRIALFAFARVSSEILQVWNVATGSIVPLYQGHAFGVVSASWSPDGKYIASLGQDMVLQIWIAESGAMISTLPAEFLSLESLKVYPKIHWFPDSTHIALVQHNRVESNQNTVADNTPPIDSTKAVQALDILTRNIKITHLDRSELVRAGAWAWSPDGKQLAASSFQDKMIHLWDTLSGDRLLTYDGSHSEWIWAVAWSPDGKRIASGSSNGVAKLWGRDLAESLSYVAQVRVWDIDTGATCLTYCGHAEEVSAIAWSPDGKWIASAGGDNAIQVWHAITGEVILTHYPTAVGAVSMVVWSPDGKWIASAGYGVEVWQAP